MEYLRERKRELKRGIVIDTILVPRKIDNFDLDNVSEYEGQLIRVDRNAVYKVEDGVASYVSSLPTLVNGKSKGWPDVIEVGETKKQNVLQKVVNKLAKNTDVYKAVQKSPASTSLKQGVTNAVNVTAMDAPKNLLKGLAAGAAVLGAGLGLSALDAKKAVSSVNAGGNPVKGDIVTTAITNTPTNSNLADRILEQAKNAAPELKNKAISKGKEYLTDKLGNISRSPEMLPKTQGLVDAERYAEANGIQQPLYSQLPGGIEPTQIIIGVLLVLLVVFMFKQNS